MPKYISYRFLITIFENLRVFWKTITLVRHWTRKWKWLLTKDLLLKWEKEEYYVLGSSVFPINRLRVKHSFSKLRIIINYCFFQLWQSLRAARRNPIWLWIAPRPFWCGKIGGESNPLLVNLLAKISFDRETRDTTSILSPNLKIIDGDSNTFSLAEHSEVSLGSRHLKDGSSKISPGAQVKTLIKSSPWLSLKQL